MNLGPLSGLRVKLLHSEMPHNCPKSDCGKLTALHRPRRPHRPPSSPSSCVPNVTDKTKTIRFNWPAGREETRDRQEATRGRKEARRGEATMTTVRGKCGEGGGYKKEKCVRKTTTRAAAEGKSVAKGADRAKGKRERERGEKADGRTANEGKANGKHSMKRN